MADRIKFLLQKRTSLKSQITILSNLLEKGGTSNTSLKLRIARLTELYHAFEGYNDELVVADPNDAHIDEFVNIQDRFYNVASKIEEILNPANTSSTVNSSIETRSDNAENAAVVKTWRIKLPEAPLPTFDGKVEMWLSFKNAFRNMIGSRTDLSDIDKLHYLKSALTGEAANKTRIFEVDGIHYTKAWELLERSYEVKRILISRHLSLITNMTVLEKETSSVLSKLADDTQQHVASLNALGVSIGPEMLVHMLESKLPKGTLEKWETTFERDEFPKLDDMYEFLYKTAMCASKRERSKVADAERDKGEPPAKRKRGAMNRAFVLNAARNCLACKVKRHPLYLCDKFKGLSVPKRIELVKGAKACYNCLRLHRDTPCKFSSCTICQRRHNTLLHPVNYAAARKSNATKPETTQTE